MADINAIPKFNWPDMFTKLDEGNKISKEQYPEIAVVNGEYIKTLLQSLHETNPTILCPSKIDCLPPWYEVTVTWKINESLRGFLVSADGKGYFKIDNNGSSLKAFGKESLWDSEELKPFLDFLKQNATIKAN